MTSLSPVRSALTFGAILALYHAAWAVLVIAGVAQAFLDFVFWAHFMKPALVVEAFSAPRFVALLAITGGLGFLIGYVFTLVWNRFHRAA